MGGPSQYFIDFGIEVLHFLSILGGPWGALGRHLAPFRHLVGALGEFFCSLDRLSMVPGPTFGRHFTKSYTFLILIPLCSGIGAFRGLAVQVGATGSIKSHPGDARGGQNGGQDGKKGVGPSQSGRFI